MYVVKEKQNGVEKVVLAYQDEQKAKDAFIDHVILSASNGDEYTSADVEAILERGNEQVGPKLISLQEVSEMTESEFIAAQGHVCRFCHSDEVDPGALTLDDGVVSRELTCDICGGTTVEQYTLAGYED